MQQKDYLHSKPKEHNSVKNQNKPKRFHLPSRFDLGYATLLVIDTDRKKPIQIIFLP